MGTSKKGSMELEVSASGSLKFKTWVLKVSFHCDGCKRQVKRALQKLKGVYDVKLDSEQSTVTVVGNVSSDTLLKKLLEKGKHAEIIAETSSPKDNGSNIEKPYDPRPFNFNKQGAAPPPVMVNRGTMEEQTRINGHTAPAHHYWNRDSPHQGSASERYCRPLQHPTTPLRQPSTPTGAKYGHGYGNVGMPPPNHHLAAGYGAQQCFPGSGSNRVINRQYSAYANKASGVPAQVTGWANARPSMNQQWVAYEQTAATPHHQHHGCCAPGYRAHPVMPPSQPAALLRATSNLSMPGGYSNNTARRGGYSDHYHQYIPSQPSAYSDVEKKSSRRSRKTHKSNNTSLDIFNEENPNACSIM